MWVSIKGFAQIKASSPLENLLLLLMGRAHFSTAPVDDVAEKEVKRNYQVGFHQMPPMGAFGRRRRETGEWRVGIFSLHSHHFHSPIEKTPIHSHLQIPPFWPSLPPTTSPNTPFPSNLDLLISFNL